MSFSGFIYWLGAKGCSALAAGTELISSERACSISQQRNMGIVLLGTGVLLVGYLLFRKRL